MGRIWNQILVIGNNIRNIQEIKNASTKTIQLISRVRTNTRTRP